MVKRGGWPTLLKHQLAFRLIQMSLLNVKPMDNYVWVPPYHSLWRTCLCPSRSTFQVPVSTFKDPYAPTIVNQAAVPKQIVPRHLRLKFKAGQIEFPYQKF